MPGRYVARRARDHWPSQHFGSHLPIRRTTCEAPVEQLDFADMPTVSVCIATYRRNEQLRALLDDLLDQERLPEQIVVVDNDAAGGAGSVISEYRRACLAPRLTYDVQPEPNIALTRNRTVGLATEDWLAFIDDDERAPRDWLRKLMEAALTYGADGVLAPVEPRVPDTAPPWIRRGSFYDFPHQRSGEPVLLNRMRFGNVLLRGEPLRAEHGPFDPSFGLTAGEDGELLVRLAHKGARIVWFEQAPVFEPIEAKRLSLKWLMQRALSGGQTFARAFVTGRYRSVHSLDQAIFYARASLQMLAAAALASVIWPLGRHRSAAWLIKASANYGKLSTLWGARHHGYARSSSVEAGLS